MVVYILYSESINQYYAGITADIDDRMLRHNQGRSISTKKGLPWKLIETFKVSDRSEAVKLEKQIKSRGIQRWLEGQG
jgi:putative endonuclease